MNRILISYKEGGYSLIWFDEETKRLCMYSTVDVTEKTIEKIEEKK